VSLHLDVGLRQQHAGEPVVREAIFILVIVQSQGGSADDVVKLTFYYAEEPADRTRHSRALRAMFGERRPPMTLIRVVGLADAKYKVEVDAMAAIADPSVSS